MINLIPQSAKKKLLLEYWVRTLSVWGVLWASALILGAVALLPAFVLIGQQVDIYAASAASASEKVAEYQDVTDQLRTANVQAREAINTLRLPQFSTFITAIKALQGTEIVINSIEMKRGETVDVLAPFLITGVANNRQSLAAFRDRLLAESWVESVDLPISNLAQGEDISFSITVTLTSEESV